MSSIAPVTLQPKQSRFSAPWFRLGLVGIFLVSLGLRFWELSRFNTLVFDEVYYAKFASAFLKGETILTGHPPLSTYIIALGIWLGEQLPWVQDDPKNALAGLMLAPFSYRWFNALFGSLIPLLVAAIAYQLSTRRSYALIAGLFAATDGLFLVESRYALNNIYIILFGLLGQVCFLIALRVRRRQQWLWLSLAGINLGASISVKWNGLGFLLGLYAVWVVGWLLHWAQKYSANRANTDKAPHNNPDPSSFKPVAKSESTIVLTGESPLKNLTQLHLGHILLCLVLLPAIVYYLSWIPYVQLDPTQNFWSLQAITLDYHHRIGGLNAHPYCSLWYTWPLLLRPIAYFYETAHSLTAPAPIVGPPLPNGTAAIVYDIHAMGNPILWWLSTAAILLFTGVLVHQLWQHGIAWVNQVWTRQSAQQDETRSPLLLSPSSWIALYLVLNWLANLLPWARVTRCVFLYHYMEGVIFSWLAIALLVDRWLRSSQSWRRGVGISVIFAILLAFVFWMPLYLGLPLTPEALNLRRWLPSWI